ncbi:PRC-barrel domain-containing protein [Arboricoccus pini]|uniref:PRC-barrel domain-containing protein n=1 Tax=Arboricoccus pini TaxID=1963835 RepID=A0A212R6E9_9PROT|nr:PRC-barrel domain-containing protein [Arboricoccus pini]SNB67719.1 PRC-barrel domain-containing protein [Arboricoccus pini]
MRVCPSLLLCLLLASLPALAEEGLPGSPTGRFPGGSPAASSEGASARPPPQAAAILPVDAVRASQLLNKPVLGIDGKSLGTIVDLELDLESGEVTHFVVKTGGFMGVGGTAFLLGRRAVRWAPDGALRTDMTAAQMQNLVVLPEAEDPVRATEDASPPPPER